MSDDKAKVIGGSLRASSGIIAPSEPFQVWFKPDLSGKLTTATQESIKDTVKLELTFYPEEGEPIPTTPIPVDGIALKKELLFRVTTAQSKALVGQKGGFVMAKAISKIDNSTEFDEIEIQVVALERVALRSSAQTNNALANIADKDQYDINVLNPVLPKSPLVVLFNSIEDSTNRISFTLYNDYVNRIFCQDGNTDEKFKVFSNKRFLPFNDTDSYRMLKVATEAFLMLNAGVCCEIDNKGDDEEGIKNILSKKGIHFAASDNEHFSKLWKEYLVDEKGMMVLPYLYLIRQKFGDIGITTTWIDDQIERELCKCGIEQSKLALECFGIVRQRLICPLFLELIWSYWQEEGMLVQSMNAVTMRFQNMKTPGGGRDPLAEMEISHLRPLNNVLWGYVQDQQHMLSVQRRAYEYDHHYGITLQGKAIPTLNSADSRTRFLEAFHGLLNITSKYYVDTANKLVEPDAFPLLNALRDVHFVIAEGMHNQYGDLPTTARMEMLMQQWIFARAEFREFLPGRAAIPFTEPWMDRVASMNKLQGWTDTSPIHFDYLAKYGEQILLSIRFGDWSSQNRTRQDAAIWANYFRNQIQGYIHSYKTATGVDLSAVQVGLKVDSTPPAFLLAKRSKMGQTSNIPQPRQNGVPISKPIKKETF